jgi:hypothetical protein
VHVLNNMGGTVTFSCAVTDNGTGISLTSNTGATISFTGGITASTGANAAFTATGGGTVSATQNNTSIINTLATTSGTALNVANTTIGASGLTFRSITAGTGAGSAGVGISLDNTGASAGLTVTGNGTAGSGGTIQHKTGADGLTTAGIGIYLNNTRNVSLSRMQLNDFDNFAIRGSSVVGFTLSNSVVSSNGGGGSWNGDNGALNEGSVVFTELTGSASFTNSSISGGLEDNVRVVNTSGTLNRITFDTVTIGANHNGAALDGSLDLGNDGIILEAQGTAVINATVQNSFFTSARGDLFQFANNGTAGNDLVFTGNALSNNYVRIATGGGGVSIAGNAMTMNIDNNTFRDAVGTAVLIVKSAGTGTMTTKFNGNTIGTAAVNSGSLEGSGIKLQQAETSLGGGTMTVAVTNNTIQRYNNDGITLQTGAGLISGGTFNATVTGNTVGPLGTNVAANSLGLGIRFNGGVTPGAPGDSYVACLQLGGAGALRNTLTGSGNPVAGPDVDYRVRQRFDTTVRLPGYGGAAGDITAVVTFIDANNIITAPAPGGTASAAFPATGGGFIGGAACPTPP